jgi:hypothetical protein
MLDITTTATIRPNLFYQTLKSFTDRLFVHQKEYRLILNVDPVGEDVDPMEMVKVGKQFFDNVVYNIPDEPNFAQACKWCWENTETDFVFHLEDDWTLSRKIFISNMLSVITKNKNMMLLRLPKLNLEYIHPIYEKQNFIKQHKLMLNPGIFRGDFIRDIASKMNIVDNPEKQLRRVFKLPSYQLAGVYCGIGAGEYIKHHGREWQKHSRYKKKKGSNFIIWEKR